VSRTARWDAIILGGGPAGLSAALILGRCRRRVILCDTGRRRNAASRALHGFLTRDGIDPAELVRIGRRQLARYGTVLVREEAIDARRIRNGFEVDLASGRRLTGRSLLIATGVADRLPPIEGLPGLYGRAVFHCPYCDGWEVANRPLAVYGRGRSGMGLSLALLTWSRRVALVCDGRAGLFAAEREKLEHHGIRIFESRVVRLEPRRAGLEVVFADGTRLARRALFFSTGQDPCSNLPRKLGCRFTRKGAVRTDRLERTGVPGLFVAGDASRDVQLAIVAAAEGAKAAFAINRDLQEEDGLAVASGGARPGRRKGRGRR
jgi:thioredoxin reductase